MTGTNLPKNKQKKIEELIEKGRKQTYLTVSDISDLLPNNQFDQDQIDQITKIITDLKIKVVDSSKDAVNEPILNDDEISDDEDSDITVDEAVEVLSNIDEEFEIPSIYQGTDRPAKKYVSRFFEAWLLI